MAQPRAASTSILARTYPITRLTVFSRKNDHTQGIPNEANRPEFNRPGPMLPGWQWIDIMPDLTAQATTFIADQAATSPRKPFFLYLPLTAPHYPVVPSREFQGRSQAGDYGDFVAQVDATVGQVLDALERAGVAESHARCFHERQWSGGVTGEVRPGVYDQRGNTDITAWAAARTSRDFVGGGPSSAVSGALAGQDSARLDERRNDLPRGLAGHRSGDSRRDASRRCGRG